MSNESAIKVMLVDPDPRVRAEMSTILGREADLQLVGESADGDDLEAFARRAEGG